LFQKFFFIITAVLSAVILSCHSKKNAPFDCDRYRTGSFYYTGKGEEIPHRFEVTRTDSLQTERDETNGSVLQEKISWVDDCGYKLLFQAESGADHHRDSALQYKMDSFRKIPLETVILSGTPDYYIFETRGNSLSFVYRDTMWVKH
jgi:hypothetical protein